MITRFLKRVSTRARRVVWRALTAIDPARVHTFHLPGGNRLQYPLATAVGADLFAGGFEPAEVAFVGSHLKPGDVILDVGANAGLYTILAARIVGPHGHVFAFEPDDRAVALLRRNIALNGLTNVTVIEAAVSNETGQRNFAAASDIAMSSLAATHRDDQQIQSWRTVDTLRLDDALGKYGIERPTFLKIDVEGAEQLVVEGATGLLARAPAGFTILFEAFEANAEPFGYTVAQLLESVQGRGFTVQGFDGAGRLRPLQDLQQGIGTTVYNFVAFKKRQE